VNSAEIPERVLICKEKSFTVSGVVNFNLLIGTKARADAK
jgi:hypothetical protein